MILKQLTADDYIDPMVDVRQVMLFTNTDSSIGSIAQLLARIKYFLCAPKENTFNKSSFLL